MHRAACRRMRILVVDGDDVAARSISRVFAYHDVIQEPDSDVALTRVRSGEWFDLVLCDAAMPKTSGVGVLDAMRGWFGSDGPTLVLMSGSDTEVAPSADVILAKPLRAAEVRRLITVARALHARRTTSRARSSWVPSEPQVGRS
jgi:CheY-like chemotaxis protein